MGESYEMDHERRFHAQKIRNVMLYIRVISNCREEAKQQYVNQYVDELERNENKQEILEMVKKNAEFGGVSPQIKDILDKMENYWEQEKNSKKPKSKQINKNFG